MGRGCGSRGKGAPGARGGPAGDLYVTVHVTPDDLFGRSGDDLTLTAQITFAEAALGTTLRVPTLDGSVGLRVPPGTPSGRTLRARGKGAPKRGGGAGDLLVTVEVAVPQNMSGDAKDALQKSPRPRATIRVRRSRPRSRVVPKRHRRPTWLIAGRFRRRYPRTRRSS